MPIVTPRKTLALGLIVVFMTVVILPTINSDEPIGNTKSGTTFYVGGSGTGNYSSIQSAINAASDGDTVFVYNGTYYENVVVNKTINLTGENRNGTIIDANDSGNPVKISANWVNISGFTITNSSGHFISGGIYITSGYNTISHNLIISNDFGIYIAGGSNTIYNTIQNNIIKDNWNGIYCISYSLNNQINNTIISNNSIIQSSYFDIGILLGDYTFNSFVSNNSFTNCGLACYFPYPYEYYSGHVVINNTVNDKPLIFLENESNINIDTPVGQVILINCENISVENQNFKNNSIGIELLNSYNCLLKENNISSFAGFWLINSYNNTLVKNNISFCVFGLFMEFSHENIISNNLFYNNTLGGMVLNDLNYDNIIYSNIFLRNNISIDMWSSFDNLIYFNNFQESIQYHAKSHEDNQWENGTFGNYWDDYTGIDSDGDGIGDTPYNIQSGSNKDNYPLMYPISSPPVFVWVDDDFNSSIPGWSITHFDIIQDAVDSVDENGTVYVFNGTYNENVVVNKTINLTGEDKEDTIIDGNRNTYVVLITSNYVNLTGFTLQNCSINWEDCGIKVQSDYNCIEDNIVILQGSILQGGDAFGIYIDNSNYSIIQNNTISNYLIGIYGIFCNYSTLRNNMIYNCGFGVALLTSSYNNITYNNCSVDYGINHTIGFILQGQSHNNSIDGNVIRNSEIGITIGGESNNNFVSNCIVTDSYQGIHIYSHSNIITKNNISNNECGLVLFGNIENNIITKNNILNNDCGLSTYYNSENNLIYHNNFINNLNYNAVAGGINLWYKEYPYAGNYWDDYTGYDNYSGPNQNIPGSDGIGDTPYDITGIGNQDNYPLMIPFGLITELFQEWNFISLPINLSVNISEIFVLYNDTFLTWQKAIDNSIILPFIYGWNHTVQSYQSNDVIIPGYGYWIYSYHSCELWIFNYERNFDNYITHLDPSWNVVGSSCGYPLEKEYMVINYNGSEYNWTEATTGSDPILVSFVFGFNRTAQFYEESDVLKPGYCYWMYAYKQCTLKRKM